MNKSLGEGKVKKQGEIREGIAKELYGLPYAELKGQWKARVDKFVVWLHSQGCVLKVDKELPLDDIRGTCLAEVNALNILCEAGYAAVEPLIK